MMDVYIKAANKTAIVLIINILIGLGLVVAWGNNDLMSYWLIFALARYIFIDSFYNVMAQKVMVDLKKQLEEEDNSENNKS